MPAAPLISPYDISKDFYSPLGISVITLYFGYLFSRLSSYRNSQDSIRGKRLSYIDFFVLELNKLISAFDALIADLDEGKKFQFKNINHANNALTELKKMINDVVIFSEEKLREDIISIIDQALVLSGDINALENFENQGNESHNNIENTVFQELRSIKLELIKIDIGVNLDTFDSFTLSTPPVADKKKEEIKKLFSDLNNKLNHSKQELNTRISFCKDKRTIFSTRILDAKTKLNGLLDQLSALKKTTQKRKYFFF